MRTILPALLVTGALLATGASQALAKSDVMTKPPANFKKVSTLVQLPEFLPGYGTLYVDPKTLPAGPFLGYDRKGKLTNITFMLPLSQLNERKNWTNVGGAAAGLSIDHTDIAYNPGHPGVPEPHYHFINWLIPHGEEAARVGSSDHAGH